ncbi:hypothetical protein MLD38_004068 [Melastoma candidum]|uniref:Uncharacterized protein n=1 Tax=Melastoma candidum TaxID=119954 RepID=A0ACB9SD26_9MYRT|nr:hypothetical protein MLD38_004068 [Melastoma candidum]
MPNSKSGHGLRRTGSVDGRSGGRNNRGSTMTGKASSFHGRNMAETPEVAAARLPRPKTVPDLRRGTGEGTESRNEKPRLLTKLLLNVTVQGSVGAVHVVMRPDLTVGDLIAAAVGQYVKEGRRMMVPAKDPALFDLHYSQFSLESLDRDEKLMNLGSRNFFLCHGRTTSRGTDTKIEHENRATDATSTCSNEAEKAGKAGFNWLKFMDPFAAMGKN